MDALPMPRPIPTLRGDAICLRACDPARDAAGYLALHADPRMVAHVRDRVPAGLDEASSELARLSGMSTISLWVITLVADGSLVGRFFLDGRRVADGIEVGEGVRIAPRAWRTGAHREARSLMTRYAFNELAAIRMTTRARLANTNMILAAEAYGYVRIADQVHDGEIFAAFVLYRATHEARTST